MSELPKGTSTDGCRPFGSKKVFDKESPLGQVSDWIETSKSLRGYSQDKDVPEAIPAFPQRAY